MMVSVVKDQEYNQKINMVWEYVRNNIYIYGYEVDWDTTTDDYLQFKNTRQYATIYDIFLRLEQYRRNKEKIKIPEIDFVLYKIVEYLEICKGEQTNEY